MKLHKYLSKTLLIITCITTPVWGNDDDERGCAEKSKKFCNLTVTHAAKIGTLFVCGNATINGDLRVHGTISGSNFPMEFPTDNGTGIPLAGVLNIFGGNDIQTNATGNTITIDFTGVSGANIYNTDVGGPAVPVGGVLNVFGGNNITTTGAGNTITIAVTGTTQNALLIGDAAGALASLPVATNGQIPIGSTGAAPVIANITAGSGVTVTNGAGSITLALATAGAGAAYVQGGNTFGATGTLGLNDNNTLNIRTNSTTRLSISNTGAVSVAQPNSGDALTVTSGNGAGENALVIVGGTGAAAETITAAGTQTALDILAGNINLTNSTSANTGNITKGGTRFLHNSSSLAADNTFLGINAGTFTVTGTQNTGIGTNALQSITSGVINTAVGANALQALTAGSTNTAVGYRALQNTTNSTSNTAIGASALVSLTSAVDCVAIGVGAGATITTGSNHTLVGFAADVFAGISNCIVLQSRPTAGGTKANASNQIRIGFGDTASTTCFIDGIRGIAGAGNLVNITASGQLTDSTASSRRYKNNIQHNIIDTEQVLALEPARFTWKNDPEYGTDLGLIAEQVHEVLPDMVIYNSEGEIHGVQYKWLPILLLAVIKEHQRTIATMQQRIDQLEQR